MRLFIAIPLNEEMRRAVLAAQETFRRHGVRGNYTRAENLHLTLAFIGEYDDPEAVLEAMDAAAFRPFELRLEGVGAFDDLWWIGLEKSEALNACVRSLRHALAEAGIPFDRKRFSPHITLVRRAVAGPGGMPGLSVAPAGMCVERICLMRSDRGKDGMIYTEIT